MKRRKGSKEVWQASEVKMRKRRWKDKRNREIKEDKSGMKGNKN